MKRTIDPSGIHLTPSWQGKKCAGNGTNGQLECACDECDFFLKCYPQFDVNIKGIRKKLISVLIPEKN